MTLANFASSLSECSTLKLRQMFKTGVTCGLRELAASFTGIPSTRLLRYSQRVDGCLDVGLDDMVRLDPGYIARRSLAMDLKIILKTIAVVFTGKGAV